MRPSIAALCCSLDRTSTRYATNVKAQAHRQEVMEPNEFCELALPVLQALGAKVMCASSQRAVSAVEYLQQFSDAFSLFLSRHTCILTCLWLRLLSPSPSSTLPSLP